MKCPFCHHVESKVTDSRIANDTNAIRRRRECLKCFKRFTTFETVDLTVQVKKRDGHYEDFDMDKLIRGLASACRHTRVSYEQIRELSSDIAMELMGKQVREITAVELGEICMKKLQVLDDVAYIRFACVYKRFKDMDQLINAIQTLESEPQQLKK
jgi:transcriptional repressor NrdR